MGRLSTSTLVRKLAEKSFKDSDVDGDGSIDAKELHIALLFLYDKLNKTLPVHFQPPDHDLVTSLVRKYDVDGSGRLSYPEYYECVTSVVGANENARLRDTLPFIVASRMLLKMAVFPLAALGLKALLCQIGGVEKVAKHVPNAAMVFGVEGLAKVGAVKLLK